MINTIILGHALNVLPQLPAESVNCVTTSPPYWGLRDYCIEPVIWDGDKDCEHEWGTTIAERIDKTGFERNRKGLNKAAKIADGNTRFATTDIPAVTKKSNFCQKCGAWRGSLGLEPTFELYIKHLCDIFDEVKRVLRKDGTCWVNLGDSYAGSGKAGSNPEYQNRHTEFGKPSIHTERFGMPTTKIDYPAKSLCLIPQRFVIEMVNRGWILRNTIIWHKKNCMPSSAKDRFTVDFEYVYFFVKSKRYWFEQQFEEHMTQENRPDGIVRNRIFNYQGKYKVPYSVQPRTKSFIETRNLPDINIFSTWLNDWRKQKGIIIDEIEQKMDSQAPHHWFNDEAFPSIDNWREFKKLYNPPNNYDEQLLDIKLKSSEKQSYPLGRNKRAVWTIPTKPFAQAHFAVFPEALIEPMIQAGCPESVCKKCGKARVKIINNTERINTRPGNNVGNKKSGKDIDPNKELHKSDLSKYRQQIEYKEVGYTDCGCNAGWESGITLDPFMGAGTTALVALKQKKRFIGVEIKQEYIDMSYKRIAKVQQEIF